MTGRTVITGEAVIEVGIGPVAGDMTGTTLFECGDVRGRFARRNGGVMTA